MFVLISPDRGVTTLPLIPARRSRVEKIAKSAESRRVDRKSMDPLAMPNRAHSRLRYDLGESETSRQPATTVDQIMNSSVITLRPDNSIGDARDLLNRKPIQHLPIVSETGELVGMVSDRDILVLPLTEDHRPLQDIMSREVIAATAETSIRELASRMVDEQVHCIPVLDKQHKLLGIVTSADVLSCVVNQAPLDLWA